MHTGEHIAKEAQWVNGQGLYAPIEGGWVGCVDRVACAVEVRYQSGRVYHHKIRISDILLAPSIT